MKLNTFNLAKFLFKYLYRDLPIIEDSHAGYSINLSMEFYNKVSANVAKKIVMLSELEMTEEMYVTLSQMPHNGIDDPVELELPNECTLNAYILEGEFLNACVNNVRFNDAAMKRINKDIVNRVYTLLINGRLLTFVDKN